MDKIKILGKSTGTIRGFLGLGLIMGGIHCNAALALGCGDTVGPTGLYILESDIGPCDDGYGPAALNVKGPVTLLMKGFVVRCEDVNENGEVPKGIVVTGTKARIINGTVSGCDDGMLFDGGKGWHTVQNIKAVNNEDDGFDVKSNNNRFIGNSANNNGDKGFALDGTGNTLLGNTSNYNHDHGVDIDGDRNHLYRGKANHNDKDGIHLDEGNSAIVTGYTSRNNADDGMEVNSSGNWIAGNKINKNHEDGIQLSYKPDDGEVANNNKVLFNDARDNNQAGVAEAYDVEDQNVDQNKNPTCDNNKWVGNAFHSSNRDCIH
jgi:parallel beta-helix repeat protein